MVRFHGICHKKCALKYVGGIVELKKLHFRGLKGQIDVKNAKFRGLIARITIIGLFRLIEPIYGPFS